MLLSSRQALWHPNILHSCAQGNYSVLDTMSFKRQSWLAKAPQEVEIADNGTTITISWDDPTEGSAGFVVLYTRDDDDSQYDKLAEANAGSTSTTVNALSEDINYCFRVGVIVAFDEIPQSEPVCTQRE